MLFSITAVKEQGVVGLQGSSELVQTILKVQF